MNLFKIEDMKTQTVNLAISNVYVQSSIQTITFKVQQLPGIEDIHIDLTSKVATIRFQPEIIDITKIQQTIQSSGYPCTIIDEQKMTPYQKEAYHFSWLFILFFFISLISTILQWSIITLAIAIGYSFFLIYHYFQGFSKTQWAIMSFSGAFLCGYMVIQHSLQPSFLWVWLCFAYHICISLMQYDDQQATKLFHHYQKTLPALVNVFEAQHEKQQALDTIAIDQMIVIRQGQIIPVDGIVIDGYAQVDQSNFLGYHVTTTKSMDDMVYANTKVIKGSLTLKVTKTGSTTAMMRIQKMALHAIDPKQFSSPFDHINHHLILYAVLMGSILCFGYALLQYPLAAILLGLFFISSSLMIESIPYATSKSLVEGINSTQFQHVIFQTPQSFEQLANLEELYVDAKDILLPTYTIENVVQFQEKHFYSIIYVLEKNKPEPISKALVEYCKQHVATVSKDTLSTIQTTFQNKQEILSHYTISTTPPDASITIPKGCFGRFYYHDQTCIGYVIYHHQFHQENIQSLKQLSTQMDVSILYQKQEEKYLLEPFGFTMIRQDSFIQTGNHSAYITQLNQENIALHVGIYIGISNFLQEDPDDFDIILLSNQYASFIFAMNIAKKTYQKIKKQHTLIMLYHFTMLCLSLLTIHLPILFFYLWLPSFAMISLILMIHHQKEQL